METTNIPQEALKLSPALGVTASTYWGFPLSDWVYIVTLIYMTLQISWLCVKIFTAIRKKVKKE